MHINIVAAVMCTYFNILDVIPSVFISISVCSVHVCVHPFFEDLYGNSEQ